MAFAMPAACVWPVFVPLATQIPSVIVHQPDRLLRQFQRLAQSFLQQQSASGLPVNSLVIACSGGADSTALLHLLHRSGLWSASALHVAHFDHDLRLDSHVDADFVKELSQQLGVVYHSALWHRPEGSGNVQDQARQARYQFLIGVARCAGARYIVTGHHQDDQAETLLDHLVRGSGPHGLMAMSSQRSLTDGVMLWRPLLPLRRHALRTWLQQQQLPWRDEPSNQRPIYRRNCLRLLALPTLEQCAGYDPIPQLASTAQIIAQTETALDWLLDQYEPSLDLRHESAGSLSLSRSALAQLPDETIVRCLLRRYQTLMGSRHSLPGRRARMAFVHLTQQGDRHGTLRLAGVAIHCCHDRLIFTATDAPLRKPPSPAQ
ncbi:MAG: tRNA lysidine(34) synthetase TilS [Magnetococcales bacterium]|nr:tRNA lysidine(34) synthetase TilS [Magnetococcales bacterium]